MKACRSAWVTVYFLRGPCQCHVRPPACRENLTTVEEAEYKPLCLGPEDLASASIQRWYQKTMVYRIKLPPKKHMIDEAQLMGGMGRLWFAMEEHRRGLLAGLAVLILAGLMVGGVVWYDSQQAQRALDIHLEANRFYATRPAG